MTTDDFAPPWKSPSEIQEESKFREPPSRKAPIHDKPVSTPWVSEDIARLQAITAHYRRSMRDPGSEPEYCEAMERLRELEAAAKPEPSRHADPYERIAWLEAEIDRRDDEDSDTLAAMARLTEERATLTIQRDAAIAVCQELKMLATYALAQIWLEPKPASLKESHQITTEALKAIQSKGAEAAALCSPAPATPSEPPEQGPLAERAP